MATKYMNLGLRFRGGVDPSLGKSFNRVGKQVKGLDKSLGQLKFQKKLTDDTAKWKAMLKRLQDAQAKTGTSNQKLNRRIAEVHDRYLRAEKAAAKYGVQVGDLTREQNRLAKAVKRTERAEARRASRAKNKQTRSNLHGQAMGLGAAAYGVGSVLRDATQFETSGIKLKTVLNSDNVTRDLKIAKDHALKTAQNNLWSETDSINVQYALNSAGLDAEAARLGSDVALKVAKITSGDAEQVGEVMATTYNNLGKQLQGTGQEKMTRIGELLTKTQFKFQIRDFNQLGESMKEAAAAMGMSKVPLEQGVTLIGALNSGGLQGSQAGTAFTATMRTMSKAAKEFGFELVDTADGQRDIIATLENLDTAIGGFDNATQETRDRLQKAFGDEGIKGLAVWMGKLKELRGTQKEVADSSKGLIDKSYQDFLNSTAGQMELLGNNARITGTVMAGALLPGINAVLTPIVDLAKGAASLAQEYPIVGKVAGGLVTAFVGLAGTIWVTRYSVTLFKDGLNLARGGMSLMGKAAPALGGKLASMGSGIAGLGGKLFGLARSAIPAVIGGIKAMGLAMVTNPIGLAIAGIAVAAGLVIYYWDDVKAFFLKIWEPIAPYWEAFTGWLGGLWDPIIPVWTAITEWAGGIWDSVAARFDAFIGYVTSKIDAIKGVVTDVVDFFSFGDDKKKEQPKKKPAPTLGVKTTTPPTPTGPVITGATRLGRASFSYHGQGGAGRAFPTGPPPAPKRTEINTQVEQHIKIVANDLGEGYDQMIRQSAGKMQRAVTDAMAQGVHDQQRVNLL